MKINGKEVDMQKVVRLIEKEQKTVSDETKKKQSNIAKERFSVPENNPFYGSKKPLCIVFYFMFYKIVHSFVPRYKF